MKFLLLLLALGVGYFLFKKLTANNSKPDLDSAPNLPSREEDAPIESEAVSMANETSAAPEPTLTPVPTVTVETTPQVENRVLEKPVEEIIGLPRQVAKTLRAEGLASIERLAGLEDSALPHLSQTLAVPMAQLMQWVSIARLMRDLPFLDAGHAALLLESGMTNVDALSQANPTRLNQQLNAANVRHRHVKVVASEKTISRWQGAVS